SSTIANAIAAVAESTAVVGMLMAQRRRIAVITPPGFFGSLPELNEMICAIVVSPPLPTQRHGEWHEQNQSAGALLSDSYGADPGQCVFPAADSVAAMTRSRGAAGRADYHITLMRNRSRRRRSDVARSTIAATMSAYERPDFFAAIKNSELL